MHGAVRNKESRGRGREPGRALIGTGGAPQLESAAPSVYVGRVDEDEEEEEEEDEEDEDSIGGTRHRAARRGAGRTRAGGVVGVARRENVIHAPPGFVVPRRSSVVATPHTASHADSDRAEGAERLARQDGSALTLGPVAALGDAAVLQLAEGVSIDTIAAGAAGAQHGELSGGAKVHHGGAGTRLRLIAGQYFFLNSSLLGSS